MAIPNTLAYNDTATITAVKSFNVQTPGELKGPQAKGSKATCYAIITLSYSRL
jgi:hypothetical protein